MQLGKHVIVELYGCDPEKLNDPAHVEHVLCQAQMALSATILNVYTHRFSPQGVTCVVQISESHLSIHTWPEYGYQQLDLFTCGAADPQSCVEFLANSFSCRNFTVSCIQRGAEFDRKSNFACEQRYQPAEQVLELSGVLAGECQTG